MGAKGLKTQSPYATLLDRELIKVWLKIKMQVIGSGKSQLGSFLYSNTTSCDSNMMPGGDRILDLFQVYTVDREVW